MRIRTPTPATVIACIALAVALSGTGYAALKIPANSVGTAQLKKNAVTTAKVRNGSLVAADFRRGQIPAGPQGPVGPAGPAGAPGAAATALWAVVASNGTVPRSKGLGSGSNRSAAGSYSVVFNQDVSNCTFEATVGATGTGVPPTGVATVAGLTGNGNGVFVRTQANGGANADRPFHLAVFC
jgi:hypothetical protein